MFSEMLVYKNTVYEFAYKVTSTTTTTLVTKKINPAKLHVILLVVEDIIMTFMIDLQRVLRKEKERQCKLSRIEDLNPTR